MKQYCLQNKHQILYWNKSKKRIHRNIDEVWKSK